MQRQRYQRSAGQDDQYQQTKTQPRKQVVGNLPQCPHVCPIYHTNQFRKKCIFPPCRPCSRPCEEADSASESISLLLSTKRHSNRSRPQSDFELGAWSLKLLWSLEFGI